MSCSVRSLRSPAPPESGGLLRDCARQPQDNAILDMAAHKSCRALTVKSSNCCRTQMTQQQSAVSAEAYSSSYLKMIARRQYWLSVLHRQCTLPSNESPPPRTLETQAHRQWGLGFWSVLNWSRTPVILSGALSLAYCPSHLSQKLRELTAEYPMLAQVVMEGRQAEDDVNDPGRQPFAWQTNPDGKC
jgi:hypothetical protein